MNQIKLLLFVSFISSFVSCTNLIKKCNTSEFKIENYRENEINYYSEIDDSCLIEGIRLGEIKLSILFKSSVLDKRKKIINLTGKLEFNEDVNSVYVSCYLGKNINGKVCKLKHLKNIKSEISDFSISFHLNSKFDVLVFQSVGFIPTIYKVGEIR